MNYLFIQPEFENLGFEYISAVLKQMNCSVELVFIPRPLSNTAFQIGTEDVKVENSLIEKAIYKHQPDVICFSPFSSYFRWCVEKADFIKSIFPDIFILFGGVHATFIPEKTITEPSIDAVLIGEGETAIEAFTKRFRDKNALVFTPNIWMKKDGNIYKNDLSPLINLDDLPYPDKDLFYDYFPAFEKTGTFTTMTSRGCPHRCSYCCNSVYNQLYKGQRIVRYQSPEYIIEQLEYFKNKYHFKRVDFMDDVFTTRLSRLETLLPMYKKAINLPFICFMYPNSITASPKLIKLLKENGCVWLKIGVQSANESYRKEVLYRKERNEQITKIAELCNQYNIRFSFDHILQLPGETKEDLTEAVDLYNRCRPSIINFGALIYLPKTPIVDAGLKNEELSQEDVEKINSGEETQVLSSNIERFKGGSERLNYSIFTCLFILITLLPRKSIDYLLEKGICDTHRKVPGIVLLILKVLSKFKVGQGYIYLSAIRYSLYYNCLNLYNNILKR